MSENTNDTNSEKIFTDEDVRLLADLRVFPKKLLGMPTSEIEEITKKFIKKYGHPKDLIEKCKDAEEPLSFRVARQKRRRQFKLNYYRRNLPEDEKFFDDPDFQKVFRDAKSAKYLGENLIKCAKRTYSVKSYDINKYLGESREYVIHDETSGTHDGIVIEIFKGYNGNKMIIAPLDRREYKTELPLHHLKDISDINEIAFQLRDHPVIFDVIQKYLMADPEVLKAYKEYENAPIQKARTHIKNCEQAEADARLKALQSLKKKLKINNSEKIKNLIEQQTKTPNSKISQDKSLLALYEKAFEKES